MSTAHDPLALLLFSIRSGDTRLAGLIVHALGRDRRQRRRADQALRNLPRAPLTGRLLDELLLDRILGELGFNGA